MIFLFFFFLFCDSVYVYSPLQSHLFVVLLLLLFDLLSSCNFFPSVSTIFVFFLLVGG